MNMVFQMKIYRLNDLLTFKCESIAHLYYPTDKGRPKSRLECQGDYIFEQNIPCLCHTRLLPYGNSLICNRVCLSAIFFHLHGTFTVILCMIFLIFVEVSLCIKRFFNFHYILLYGFFGSERWITVVFACVHPFSSLSSSSWAEDWLLAKGYLYSLY